jgi:aminoglycoside N3'-acetyltransferase
MIREEAIEILKEIIDEGWLISDFDKCTAIDACEMAIKNLKTNDRNEMIVNDIKRIIKRYDEMNLSVSFEERKENHIKAYMEIKDYFNNYAAEDK